MELEGEEASTVQVKTGSGETVSALQLPQLYQNEFRVAIMPGVEKYDNLWILIIKINSSQNSVLSANDILALLKNPTPESIRELKIPSKEDLVTVI